MNSTTRQERTSSEKAEAARAYNQARISKSLDFHRDRLVWLAEPAPVWGDGLPVLTYEIRLYGQQSHDAIRMLEQGLFVAGGDA